MNKGWISVHRQICENEYLWDDKPFARGQAWIDLLMMVNCKPKKIVQGNSTIFVGCGSTVTSIRKLADRWGWGKTKVSDFLNSLQSASMIKLKADTKRTIITVANYRFFQNLETENGHQADTGRTANGTNNNDNNIYNNSIYLYSGEKTANVENHVENPEAGKVWKKVLSVLETELSSTTMTTWFGECRAESWDGHRLKLWDPSSYKLEVIERNFGNKISEITDALVAQGVIT